MFLEHFRKKGKQAQDTCFALLHATPTLKQLVCAMQMRDPDDYDGRLSE